MNGYETFIIPDNIGGRYSVLTAVGLLPIAVAGIDIDKLKVLEWKRKQRPATVLSLSSLKIFYLPQDENKDQSSKRVTTLLLCY